MVVRSMAVGFPGCSRSSSVRAQQAICTMRRKAMQRRKEDSLPMVLGGCVGVEGVVGVVWLE